MKHLKHFNRLNEHDMSYFYPMSRWIESVWKKLSIISEDDLGNFFDKLENIYSMEIISIIDGMYSDDKLHYHQNRGAEEFIENFDDIKITVDGILKNDFGVSDDAITQIDKFNV
jgi:hypothetical protein